VRIVQVVDIGWLAGGAERSVLLLRDRLRAQGHDVRVVSTDKNSDGQEMFADVVVPHIQGGSLRRLRDFAFYRKAYRAMRGLVRAWAPDVIHFHTVGELSPAVLFAARRTPHIVTVHGPEEYTRDLLPWQLPATDYRGGSYRRRDLRAVGRLRIGYLRFVQRPIYLLALRRCFAFVAPSKFMAEVLTQEVAPAQIVQIYNGIDLPDHQRTLDSQLLLYVGRLEAVKGVDVLIRSFAEVHESRPRARLLIVGDGTQREALSALCDELGVAERVSFTGWLPADQVRECVVGATSLVIPSVWPENLPTVALEAIGIGRAIVASSVGGIPELVTVDQTGLLAAPYDVSALTNALGSLLGDPLTAERMGTAARDRASAFAADRFVANVTDLYAKAVAA
jgi:glycosyltransferase involved in cell wall biosynthesis